MKSPWDFHGLFGVPTDRVGGSFNFFVRPLSKLSVSDAQLRVREKHTLARIFSEGAGGVWCDPRNYFNYLEEPFRLVGGWGGGEGVHLPYLLDCKRTKLSRVV